MSALSSAAGGAIDLTKSIIGMVQTARANKGINRLLAQQPTYSRPEEYGTILAMRKQMAAQGKMPGQAYAEGNIGQAAATARASAREGAISSTAYQKSIGDIYSKQLQAFQDLSQQSALWQQQQRENLAQTYQQGAGYADTEWEQNKLRPWEIKMQQFQSQKQSGAANMFGGAEGMVGNLQSYAGTSYYQKMLDALMGVGGNNISASKSPFAGQQFSQPVQGYNPQQNLLNILSGMTRNTKINYPNG